MNIKRQPPFWIILLLQLRYVFKLFQQKFLGPKQFEEIDIHGKVVIITGANSGLGKTTALEIGRRGATVILACRNLEAGNRAAEEIKTKTQNNNMIVLELDLFKFTSIRKFCGIIEERFPTIDLLINNAGIYDPSTNIKYTSTGLEKHFAVNHLGHFLLTNLLLQNLKRASASRIVTIGSTADFIEELQIDDLNFKRQKGISGYGYLLGRIFGKAYAASKFANSLFTAELAQRLKSTGVTTYALCPGMVSGTDLFKYDSVIDTFICNVILKIIGLTHKEGVETILYCALSKSCQHESGLYYQFNQLHPYANYRNAHNTDLAKKLWLESEKLLALALMSKVYQIKNDLATASQLQRCQMTGREIVQRAKSAMPSKPASLISESYLRDMSLNRKLIHQGWEIDPFVYRLGEGRNGLPSSVYGSILQSVCEERGWKEFGPEEERLLNGNLLGWNIWWKTIFSSAPQRSLYSWQFVNFIPRAIGFCNKEYLARYMSFMQETYGSICDFCPTTYVLPEDFWKLDAEHTRRSQLNERRMFAWEERARNLIPIEPGVQELESLQLDRTSVQKNFQPIWIAKPIGKSQGKGIILLNDTSTLTVCESNCVVQEYIARPLLIAGHKFDLRLYILIPSTMPLTIYVYNEGLTRFAVEKYDLKNLGRNYSHLTNATLNKMSPEYLRDKDCLGVGCKWTLQRLRQYLKAHGRPDWFMWQRIVSIVILTLVGEFSKTGTLPHCRNCFEFLGYDILLDQDLRPWLLEVNHSPGLNADCEVDRIVKNPLLHDLFNLLGLPNQGPRKAKDREFFINDLLRGPLPGSRPTTVASTQLKNVAAEMKVKFQREERARQERSVAKQSLRSRLLELTAIYSQDLTQMCMKPPAKGKKKTSLASSNVLNNEEDESVSSKSKRGIKLRDWIHPIKKCGGWVRVFPFDALSHEQSRGKIALDTKLLVNHIYCNLKRAREITLRNSAQTDQEYADALKQANKLTTEVWIPPNTQN